MLTKKQMEQLGAKEISLSDADMKRFVELNKIVMKFVKKIDDAHQRAKNSTLRFKSTQATT